MILLQLFWSFLQIGLFSFGGGYAAMPLIQAQIVTQHGWLGMAEFTDLVTISQMTPGPIAINAATFVGLRVAGVSGALAATVGCMLPSCVLVTLLARLFAIYRRAPVTVFLLCGIFPLVPGAGIYYTAYYFIFGFSGMMVQKGIETVKVAVAIALGITLVLSLPMGNRRSQ